MGKAGFELEIGGMQFNKGFKNSVVLAAFQRGEKDFFRIEAEGQKVLGEKSAYPEIVSAPFATKGDICFFFKIIKLFCMEAGENTFDESVRIIERCARGEVIVNLYDSPKYQSKIKEKNPSIQTNLSIPYYTLYDLKLGDDFERAKGIAKEIVEKYGGPLENALKRKLMSFFAQLAYQTYVYTKNKIDPTVFCYSSCRISEEILADVESHEEAATGTKVSNAKLHFDVLLKTSQAEVLNEIFTEEERTILLAVMDNYRDLWGRKFEGARGGLPVCADSYAFAKIRQRVEWNIAACNGQEGAKFVFTEPRIASIIGIQNGEIVIELRKSKNPVNALLREYCDRKRNKELTYINTLFPLLKEEYNIEFPD